VRVGSALNDRADHLEKFIYNFFQRRGQDGKPYDNEGFRPEMSFGTGLNRGSREPISAKKTYIYSMTMIFGFLGFVFVATVAGVIFFGSLYLWIRYVFGEKHAGKVTGFCLKLTLVLVAVAILAEPVLLVVGIFWLTVEYSNGLTLLIPAVLFGLPLVRFFSNRSR
jgi:hypothetical protein